MLPNASDGSYRELIRQKIREITYAAIRVAAYVKSQDLKARLERVSFDLLENATNAVLDAHDAAAGKLALKNSAMLETLIRMGHALYEIEPSNATILVKELDALSTALKKTVNAGKEQEDIQSVFSGTLAAHAHKVSQPPVPMPAIRAYKDPQPSAPMGRMQGGDGAAPANQVKNMQIATLPRTENIQPKPPAQAIIKQVNDNAAIRQSAIVKFIKDINAASGNSEPKECKLKEITTAFPHVSERTMRYDLQKLCEQGLLQRIGNGGPGSFYRLKS